MISKKTQVKAAAKGRIGHLVSYLLDPQGKPERVAAVAVTNCHNDDPRWAVREMQAVQSRNQRAKADRTYHLVVSLRAGEELPGAALAAVEAEFCRVLGFAEHQRLSVVHRDTDHLHLHVAINKVHPQRFTLHEPFNDYHARAQLCRRLERRFGLEPEGTGADRQKPVQTHAAAMEAAGLESLTGYVARTLAGAVASARSWAELHAAFAEAGVVLQPRSGGLVVESGGRFARASGCLRELSKPALEKRLGAFQPPGQEPSQPAATPKKTYAPRPLRKDGDQLYGQYQAARRSAQEKQRAGLEEALAAHRRRVAHARTAYQVQRTIIGLTRRTALNTVMLRLHQARLESQAAASLRTYQAERRAVFQATKRLAWKGWLAEQADAGHPGAQAMRRSLREAPAVLPRSAPALPFQNKTRNHAQPDYCQVKLPRAPLPRRPDYRRDAGGRPSLATRLVRAAAALLQSRLGQSGRRGPAGTFAGLRDLSGLDVVHDGARAEMLLRAHEPDRLGSEVGLDTHPEVRRAGAGATRPGRGTGAGGSQSRPPERVTAEEPRLSTQRGGERSAGR